MNKKDIFVSVIVPCFNEEKSLKEIILKVLSSLMKSKFKYEILIIDDYSSDNSCSVANKLIDKNHNIKLIKHSMNLGKGAALQTGFAKAKGNIVLIQDADLEYNPDDYPLLISPFYNSDADVVYGSRFVKSDARRVLYYWHRIANALLTHFSNMFTNLNLTDMETCYKVFRKDILGKILIKEKRFGFEPEITAKVAKMKCKVFEVGISYSPRSYEEGKKIGLKDAIRAFYCIVKYNFFD